MKRFSRDSLKPFILIAAFLLLGLLSLAISSANTPRVALDGDGMSSTANDCPDSGASGGSFVGFGAYCAGQEPQPAGAVIGVRMYGDTGTEQVELRISDQAVKTWTLGTSYQDYTYEHPSSLQIQDLKIAFINDGSANGVDRNAYVDYLVLDGTTYQTEAPDTYSTGTYDAATACNPGYKQREKLGCNGYFAYKSDATVVSPTPTPSPVLDSTNYLFHLTYDHPVGPYTKSHIQEGWSGAWLDGEPWGMQYASIVSGSKAYSGNSLKLVYKAGGIHNVSPGNYRINLGKKYNELYYSVKVRTEDNFNGVRGGKLPGLCGGKCNSGGSIPTGYDGWSARNMWRDSGARMVHYPYTADQTKTVPDDLRWNIGGDRYLQDGRWHTLEHRIVMNTPGQSNGIIQGWFDGVLVLDKRNVMFRKTTDLAIDKFYFSTFYGGGDSSWAPSTDQVIYYDDLIISQSPITH